MMKRRICPCVGNPLLFIISSQQPQLFAALHLEQSCPCMGDRVLVISLSASPSAKAVQVMQVRVSQCAIPL